MDGLKLSTIASAMGSDSDDGTPEELYIVNPPAKKEPISSKWVLDPKAAAEAAAQSANDGDNAASGAPSRAVLAKRRQQARDNAKSEKFPTHEEMCLLPQEIQSTLLELVMEYFRRKIYPRLVFLSYRKQRRATTARAVVSAPTVSAGFIQSVPLFSRWPGIENVIRSMRLLVLERGSLLTHQGDPSAIGVFFLVQGVMQCCVKRPASQMQPVQSYIPGIVRGVNGKPVSRKSLGTNNCIVKSTLEAPVCYGEMALLTEEPRLESLRAVTRCLIWVLDRSTFFSNLNALSADRRANVTDVAFQQRRENIPRVFPVTGQALHKVNLFSHIPVDQLDALAPRMEPRVFQEGQCICRIGDPGTEMYLICRGHMSVAVISSEGGGATTSPTGASVEEADDDGSVESFSGPGSVVGEMSVLFSQKRNITLHAVTTCDVYAITRDMIVQSVTNQRHMTLLLQKAHSIQAQRQKHAKSRFAEHISRIPLVSHVATPAMSASLLEAFSSKVYPPHSTVITVSEVADRLVIIVRGKARLTSTSRDMGIGECVGYTCIIPHRWTYHVVALDTVETIELSCDNFLAIARHHGAFKELKELTHGLLYPRVYPDAFQRAFGLIKSLPGPPSFPSSSGYEVKPFAARVTSKPSLPLAHVKRRPRTDAGLYFADDQEAAAFVPPPVKSTAQLPLSDDDDAQPSRAAAANEANDDDSTVDDAAPDSPSKANSPSPTKRNKASSRKVDYAAVASTHRQRTREEDIERLAARIRELQRSGPVVGSPARAHRKARTAAREQSAERDAQNEASPTSKVDDDASQNQNEPQQRARPTAGGKTRTVGMQTIKSYIMTRYKVAEARRVSGQPAAPEADVDPASLPDNCLHEAVEYVERTSKDDDAPAEQDDKPAATDDKPADNDRPAAADDKPADADDKPAAADDKPAAADDKPADADDKPADSDKAAAADEAPATDDKPTADDKPASDDEPAAADEPKSSAALVSESWGWVKAGGDLQAVGKLFYDALFEDQPDLLNTLFKGVDREVQADKLMKMIDAAVGLLDAPDKLVPALQSLGERHAGYGVEDEHYPAVGKALIATLHKGLGEKLTSEHKKAWVEVFGIIEKEMKAGAASEEGQKKAAAYKNRTASAPPPGEQHD